MSDRYPGGLITKTPVVPAGPYETGAAPGIWTLEQQAYYAAQGLWPLAGNVWGISNSLRFRAAASANLTKTFASNGTRTTWTWSSWVKRGALGSNQCILGGGTSGSNYFTMWFTSGDIIQINEYQGANNVDLQTTQVFRDPSGWYHIVLVYDTTQSTSSNRVKLYVNGSQVTALSTATYPSQNFTSLINSTTTNYMGRINSSYSTYYLDGYLAETNFVDGSALTPSSFGETNTTTGVWQPKLYSGSYGTNGYYLPFSDIALTSGSNAGLGKDFSGNGNYWTTNNISVTSGATYDAMTDSPSLKSTSIGNYCVLNPLGANPNITSGNLKLTSTTTTNTICFATMGVSTGKWYYEAVLTTEAAPAQKIGIGTAAASGELGDGAYGWAIITQNNESNGQPVHNGTTGSTLTSYATNDIVNVAYDLDAGKIWFGKNGTWLSSGNPATGTNAIYSDVAGTVFPAASNGYGVIDFNFGQRPFAYTPPSGFVALNTYNLATPTIGASASTLANAYFSTSLYTGTGASQTISNSNFQPDFVWVKSRSNAYGHIQVDAVRGATKYLQSNSANAEGTDSNVISAFTSTGFTVGSDNATGANGVTYAGWQWKGGGSGVSNTDGTITSTVSANTTSGFSIVTFTYPSSGSFTVGHGLGAMPAMIITKHRNRSSDWFVWHKSLNGGSPGTSYYINLNSTAAQGSASNFWGSSAISSTTFGGTVGTSGLNGDTDVAYCFAEIAGFSSMGSYTGNGSTNGTFIYTGFRPAYIIVKASSAVEPWKIWDAARGPYNTDKAVLWANLTNAEVADGTQNVDLLSNGFKFRMTDYGNTNGVTYIYMAFAENPFKYALAR